MNNLREWVNQAPALREAAEVYAQEAQTLQAAWHHRDDARGILIYNSFFHVYSSLKDVKAALVDIDGVKIERDVKEHINSYEVADTTVPDGEHQKQTEEWYYRVCTLRNVLREMRRDLKSVGIEPRILSWAIGSLAGDVTNFALMYGRATKIQLGDWI